MSTPMLHSLLLLFPGFYTFDRPLFFGRGWWSLLGVFCFYWFLFNLLLFPPSPPLLPCVYDICTLHGMCMYVFDIRGGLYFPDLSVTFLTGWYSEGIHTHFVCSISCFVSVRWGTWVYIQFRRLLLQRTYLLPTVLFFSCYFLFRDLQRRPVDCSRVQYCFCGWISCPKMKSWSLICM